MKKLIELRQLKTTKVAEMRSLTEKVDQEKRSMTDDERSKFDAIKNEVITINKDIENLELLAEEERSLAGKQGKLANGKISNDELRSYIKTGDTRNLTTLVDASGGYTVIPDLDKNIMLSLAKLSPMRQICTVKTTKSNTYERLVSLGGATIGRGVEGVVRDQTGTPTMVKVSIKLNNIYAYPMTTQEILDFSEVDILGWLTTEVTDTFRRTENDDLINGDGVDKANGLLTYPTSTDDDETRPFGTMQKITVSDIKADDLIDLLYKLDSTYREEQGICWIMNSQIAAKLFKLKNGNGDYIWRERLQAGSPDILLGRPVQYVESMPDTGLVIGVGDFKRGYYIVDHTTGVRTRPDNITSPGFYKVHTDKYLGGGLVDSKAIKFLELA